MIFSFGCNAFNLTVHLFVHLSRLISSKPMMQPLNKNVIMDIRRFEMSSGFSSKEPLHLALKKVWKSTKNVSSFFRQNWNDDFWRENSNILTKLKCWFLARKFKNFLKSKCYFLARKFKYYDKIEMLIFGAKIQIF